MSIPALATAFLPSMGPRDLVDWEIELKQTTDADSFLLIGEAVASYSLSLGSEAVAAGVVIREDSGYATVLSGNVVKFWPEVQLASQNLPIFDAGITVSVELEALTNNNPPRRRRRTYTWKIVKQ